MKGYKKALAASIANVVQDKLSESGEQSAKAKKAIEKYANRLIKKLGKITSKEKKKLKQIKKNEAIAAHAEKKEIKKLKEINHNVITIAEKEGISIH